MSAVVRKPAAFAQAPETLSDDFEPSPIASVNETRRVLHVASIVTPEVNSFLSPAMQELSKAGMAQCVVAMEDRINHAHLRDLDAEVVLVPAHANTFEKWSALSKRCDEAMADGNLEAIHLHGLLPALVAAWSIRRIPGDEKPRIFLSPHASRSTTGALGVPGRILWHVLRRLLGRSTPVVVVESCTSASKLSGWPQSQAVGSPVAELFFNTVRKESPRPMVVTAGDEPRPEHVRLFAQLAVLLRDENLAIAFRWAGRLQGAQASRLRAAEVRVTALEGGDSHVAQELAKAWVHVAFGGGRGFPVHLVQAMASGLPCLAFDCDQHRELIVDGKNGLLWRDEADLARKVAQLIDNDTLRRRLGNAGRQTADSRFRARGFGDRLLEAYRLDVDSESALRATVAKMGLSVADNDAQSRVLASPPRALVVIPTLNEARSIRGVLEALHRDLPSGPTPKFVVVDGGSVDGTVELVQGLNTEYPDLALLFNPKRLQSAAVNLAVREFGAEFDALVRCDAHADYPDGFVRDVLQTLSRPGVGSVVVPMDSHGSDKVQMAIGFLSNSWLGSGGSAHRGGRRSGFVDHGHHAAFWLSHFAEAGGYDESFSHNEDAELDCRQRAMGVKIFLTADVRIVYHPRSTLNALLRQYFQYGKGRSRTLQRHRSSLRLRQLLVPATVLSVTAAIPLGVFWPPFMALPALYFSLLLFSVGRLAAEHRDPVAWLALPAAAAMHFGWAYGFTYGLLTQRERQWTAGSMAALAWSPAVPTHEIDS